MSKKFLVLGIIIMFCCLIGCKKTIIDFEDYPEGTVIHEQYADQGVIFTRNGEADGYPLITKPSLGTASGTNALTVPRPTVAVFPLVMTFASPQKSVLVHVGLIDATGPNQVKAVLNAYDSTSTLITSATVLIGPGPTAITTPLEVTSTGFTIKKVFLHHEPVEPGKPSSFRQVIDNLTFGDP